MIANLSKEALELLLTTGQKADQVANRVAILPAPKHEPDHVYYVATQRADGGVDLDLRESALKPRRSDVYNLAQIAPALAAIREYENLPDAPAIVWYCLEGITIELGRHRVELDLARTPAAVLLTNPIKLAPRDLRRALSTVLADSFGTNCEALRTALGKLKFNAGGSTSLETSRGRESMGKQFNLSVDSEEGKLPDQVTFELRVISDPALNAKYPMRFEVEPDAANATIELLPVGDAFAELRTAATNDIGTYLRETLPEGTAIIYGSPGTSN
ncbi:MAG: hypothetical protein NT069_32450 [Planctomycetota bacterium]|nr:hypothetical protein [Planctomycetota bacterium]